MVDAARGRALLSGIVRALTYVCCFLPFPATLLLIGTVIVKGPDAQMTNNVVIAVVTAAAFLAALVPILWPRSTGGDATRRPGLKVTASLLVTVLCGVLSWLWPAPFSDDVPGRFFGRDLDLDVELVGIPQSERVSALTSGEVDLVVSAFSITDDRLTEIDMAGPYYVDVSRIWYNAAGQVVNSGRGGPDRRPRAARSGRPARPRQPASALRGGPARRPSAGLRRAHRRAPALPEPGVGHRVRPGAHRQGRQRAGGSQLAQARPR